MRTAKIFIDDKLSGHLIEAEDKKYRFEYTPDYSGYPVSLTMPLLERVHHFDSFPSFFDGLLPEGPQLEGLLRHRKIDRNDLMSQLIAVGNDLVGNVTVKESDS